MTYDRTDPLVHTTATELAGRLERREVSAEEVVRSHVDRAITIESKVTAFVESMRGDALERARAIDAARARGDRVGPLAGLPVTIKENLDMAGHASTLGILHRKNLRASSDAVVVQAVRRAGGVVVGRTNVPQLLLSHESRNPVFGFTKNPWSSKHAPGGSSGGEAAALATGLSALGVGTDIGGSIRVPATWCGIAGFKPTLDRWSNRGSNGALVGQETIRSQVGPMARTARDVALLFRALDQPFMASLDPFVPPTSQGPTPVRRVGYFVSDGLVEPSKAVARAVSEACDALRGQGVEVVPFTPPNVEAAIALYFGIMSSDGGATAEALVGDSPIEPLLEPLLKIAKLPSAAKQVLARGLAAMGEGRSAFVLKNLGERSVAGLWKLTKAARDYRLELLAAMDAAKVDAMVCPAHATPAVPHLASGQFLIAGSFSMLFNLVQFPAGVVPVTTVRDEEAARTGGPSDRVERTATRVDQESRGLPIGVQVVGRPYHDETVLELMLRIEDRIPRLSTPRMPG